MEEVLIEWFSDAATAMQNAGAAEVQAQEAAASDEDGGGQFVVDEDGFLNVFFSILLVIHVAVLLGIAYFQRPWRLISCCCSTASKYRESGGSASHGGRSSSRSSSGFDDSNSGYGVNSFDMSTAARVGRRY